MVNIILAITIPLTAIISSYFTLKAYTLGLKHNYQVKSGEKIQTKIIEVPKKEKTPENTVNEVINEWLNGPQE